MDMARPLRRPDFLYTLDPAVLIFVSLSGLLLVGFAVGAIAAPVPATLPLKVVTDAPLGGHTTRLDYESMDLGRQLLFIAHLGDSQIIVFDTAANRVVTRIADVSHVHGILAIPERARVYASATGRNEVVAIDEVNFRVVARIPGGDYPDGMAYVPAEHKLYVSDERGKTVTVIDVNTNRRVATIAMGGEVGNTQYDPVSRHVFSNVQTRGDLVEIDPATDKVIARIPLAGARGNHGLLIDPVSRLAFIACEGNNKLLVLNMVGRRVSASFNVGSDPDVLALDPGFGRLYVASEAGVVSIFKVSSERVTKIGDALIGPDAHVVAVDPATHRSYFPLMNVAGRTVMRIFEPVF